MNYLPNTIFRRSQVLVAAASDGRMGGSQFPAMAAMGDGNRGLSAMIPVGVGAELMGKSNEDESMRSAQNKEVNDGKQVCLFHRRPLRALL